MKNKSIFTLIFLCFVLVSTDFAQKPKPKPKPKLGRICGIPNEKCLSADGSAFQPYDLPFEIPKNAVIYESEYFYAIILKSRVVADGEVCEDINLVPETDRLNFQKFFPSNKIFVHKCDDAGTMFYDGIANNALFMGIYAGKTLDEAKKFLKIVQFSKKFEDGIYIKKLKAGFNGT